MREDTLYPEFRLELMEALSNRNRDDLTPHIDALDDDQIADCLRLAVDYAEQIIEGGSA